jgi:hypothetical protein
MTPIGGGVELQPRTALKAERILEDKDGTLEAIHKSMDLTVIDESRWWWD